jgi:hypothetical protein
VEVCGGGDGLELIGGEGFECAADAIWLRRGAAAADDVEGVGDLVSFSGLALAVCGGDGGAEFVVGHRSDELFGWCLGCHFTAAEW